MPVKPKYPVLLEAVEKRLAHVLRLGQPFTTLEAIADKQLEELAKRCVPEPADRYGKTMVDYLSVLLQQQMKKQKYRDRIYRRVDRSTLKPERKGLGYLYYPSNDRARWHLKDNEVFVPAYLTPSSDEYRKLAEPPLVLTVPKPEPAPKPEPEPEPVDLDEKLRELDLAPAPFTRPERDLMGDVLEAEVDTILAAMKVMERSLKNIRTIAGHTKGGAR